MPRIHFTRVMLSNNYSNYDVTFSNDLTLLSFEYVYRKQLTRENKTVIVSSCKDTPTAFPVDAPD